MIFSPVLVEVSELFRSSLMLRLDHFSLTDLECSPLLTIPIFVVFKADNTWETEEDNQQPVNGTEKHPFHSDIDRGENFLSEGDIEENRPSGNHETNHEGKHSEELFF